MANKFHTNSNEQQVFKTEQAIFFLNSVHENVFKLNTFLRDMKRIAKNRDSFTYNQLKGIYNWSKNDRILKTSYEEWRYKLKPIRYKLGIIYYKLNNGAGVDSTDLEKVKEYLTAIEEYNYISKKRLKEVNDIYLKYFPET